MKMLVCGGRDFSDYAFLCKKLDGIHKMYNVTELIEGGAEGADTYARFWAESRKIKKITTVFAQWGEHGRQAGCIRNKAMAELNPDLCVAFPGGNGTAIMVRIAMEYGIKVLEVGNGH